MEGVAIKESVVCGDELLIEGQDKFSNVSFRGRKGMGEHFPLGESYATPPISILPFLCSMAQILKENQFCQENTMGLKKWLCAK